MTHRVEYLVVSDASSKVLLSTEDYYAALRLANQIRAAGGGCTLFRSLKA